LWLLREQITDAQGLLVFAPDDRAPHAIHCSCKMWYKLELQKRLQRVDVYAPMEISWSEYTQQCATFCGQHGFVVGGGLPYVYGIWKSKKARWRHIVGICKGSESADLAKPLHPLDGAHLLLVKLLKQILAVLKEIDLVRRAAGGPRAFWVV